MIRALRAFALAVAVAVLAACSSGSGYSDLDRDATSADTLPTDLPGYASEDFADDSVRFAGELEGVDYYLARLVDNGGYCVVVYRSTDEWVSGCGGHAGVFGVTGFGLNVTVAPDGYPELDEGAPVGANIVVR